MSAIARQAAYSKKNQTAVISYKWINWALPLIVVCMILFYSNDYFSNPSTLPINKIRVHGEFVNVDEVMLHRVIDGVVDAGYFNVDVEKVRKVVETLPWVDKASVRRVWPNTLSVSVEEQKPIAIAKNIGLINTKGIIFKPLNNVLPESLPVFDGDMKLNKLMLSKFYEMNKLLRTINLNITYLTINARHAVEVKLNNGFKIMLGQGETIYRLKRFVSIYTKTLAEHVTDIDVIDLRYTNGMAVSWKKIKKSLGDMNHV